jgi:hypothetical protein
MNTPKKVGKYKVVKRGLKIGFRYTPLYTNYEASSPREVEVGVTVHIREPKEKTTFYDGMPVTSYSQSAFMVGFKQSQNFGNATSTVIDASGLDMDFLEEVSA